METVPTKHCPICSKDLPISEFGIVRSRPDGLNLYCKADIRKKVNAQRRALKEYKAARKQHLVKQMELNELFLEQSAAGIEMPQSLTIRKSPAERVREAIYLGARTQKQIAQETKLGKDEIGDALANLILWTNEVRTDVVDGTRLYFLNEVEVKPKPVCDEAIPFAELSRKSNQLFVKGERRSKRVA